MKKNEKFLVEDYKESIFKGGFLVKSSLFFNHLIMWFWFMSFWFFISVLLSLIPKNIEIGYKNNEIINAGELSHLLPIFSIYFVLYIIERFLNNDLGSDFYKLEQNYSKIKKYFVAVYRLTILWALIIRSKR